MFDMPKGPFCQSCGMPMDSKELFGNNADNSVSEEYCTYCYQSGKFTAPDITLGEMKNKVVSILVDKKKMPEMQARMIANMFIPKLKRWK